MQENTFFHEPVVQQRLLDILFIYSKLNPDIGYRQGMHELLAPILWAVDCDAIDKRSQAAQSDTKIESPQPSQLMNLVLDSDFVEHDAFSLFCAVMLTGKAFYEAGNTADSSTMVARCQKIEESLATVDPELADHLRVLTILPQIYLMYVASRQVR